jgi:hypothetical protein
VAGPTTEVLNEDIKEVKSDLHEIRVDSGVLRAGLQHVNDDIKELKVDIRDIRGDITVIKNDLHNMGIGLGEFRGEFRSSDPRKVAEGLATLQGEYKAVSGIAKWGGAFLATAIVTFGSGGVWWASRLTADVRALEARFDKFEAQLGKLVEQRQSTPAIPKAEGPGDSLRK